MRSKHMCSAAVGIWRLFEQFEVDRVSVCSRVFPSEVLQIPIHFSHQLTASHFNCDLRNAKKDNEKETIFCIGSDRHEITFPNTSRTATLRISRMPHLKLKIHTTMVSRLQRERASLLFQSACAAQHNAKMPIACLAAFALSTSQQLYHLKCK